MDFWTALGSLSAGEIAFLFVALIVAFGFEFINGFHDTANAVTTVIYTRSLSPTPAVMYSGFMNFLGASISVVYFGAAVAFGIVNLLPVDVLVGDINSALPLVMVLSLLLAGVVWNLGTWYFGIPVSSSHTLIGSIVGVGIANSLWEGKGFEGVDWPECIKVGKSLLFSPLFGFAIAFVLLLLLKLIVRNPKLYTPPQGEDQPPWWIRAVLIGTCGGVSYAHGSNDGQKGMGLLLLVLIGFMPVHYALTVNEPTVAPSVLKATEGVREEYEKAGVPIPEKVGDALKVIETELKGKVSFEELPRDKNTRWEVRKEIEVVARAWKKASADESLPPEFRKSLGERRKKLLPAIEYIPMWVVIGTALALGLGTTIGYKRIVKTVAEKIGKTHLTYGQGAVAETATAGIIEVASQVGLPVSTTQVLNSAVAGTMVANGSGVQGNTITKILLAWVLTLPACMILAGLLFTLGRLFV